MAADNQTTLESLKVEVEALKARVAMLESQGQYRETIRTPVQSRPAPNRDVPVDTVITLGPPDAPAVPPASHSRVEDYIGGKLLNRVGALIVVFAVAYFLKWSFDNNIIGELGRCVLGLVGGIAFMTAGQVYQKRGYPVYAQGLTGAGIAIIYLSTFAAVNYYHLISPYIAFALMFVTALTGGLLAALENAPGTAVMATIGGFLVPFLMGSHSGQIIPLLSYVFILDLGVLFLAYYRKWLVLDVLALVGTAAISMVAFKLNWQVWPGQGFITAYLILFIAVVAGYNYRSRNHYPILLKASTLFFAMVSFVNLDAKMRNWLGLITLVGAVIFLGSYLIPAVARNTTRDFRKALLVIALIFALLTAPLQLNEVYCQLAWLAVAAVLLYTVYQFKNKMAYRIALMIIAGTTISVFTLYQTAHLTPFFNKATLVLAFSAVGWLLALLVTPGIYPHRLWLSLALSLLGVATVFYLLHFDINNAIYYYQANQSFAFLIPVSWALVSSLVLFIGVRRENKTMRLFSLVLFGVVILRTLFYDLRQLDIVYKILVLLAIGLIALAISFFYQKRIKGDEL